MSYVPPHKRLENVAAARPSSSVTPSLRTKLNNTKKIYSDDFVRRWFLVGSEEDKNSNKDFQLVPVTSEWGSKGAEGKKPLVMILVKSGFGQLESPWLWVSEKVVDDLTFGFGKAKKMPSRFGSEDVNLRLIVRFGKVLFNGPTSTQTLTQSKMEKLKKSFNTNVTNSYLENIRYGVVPKMGFCVEETKELYHVKAELNALRHLIIDVSCLHQDLDMRLSLDSKRILTNLSENEIKNLKELTDAAVIDPNVKGGLKWPLGKSSCANHRYSVCGVWHTVTTTYQNRTQRLQIREADRYDFRTGIGGTSKEVSLKLKALSKLLKEEKDVERKCVTDMFGVCLKSVWEYYLSAM